MTRGFLGSVSLHALIVLAALIGLPGMKMPEIKPVEAIQVDISNITGETKVKAESTAEEKPAEKPKPKASEAVEKTPPKQKVSEEKKLAAAEPQKQEEQKKVEPEKKEPEKKAEDKPLDATPLEDMLVAQEAELKAAEEKKKAEAEKNKKEEEKKKAEAERKKKEEEKKKAEEERKRIAAEEKKKERKLDVAELEKLLNKENEESSAPLEQKAETGTPDQGERNAQGEDESASAALADALRQKYQNECWDVPPAVREKGIGVRVKFELDPQGNLKGAPVVIGGEGGPLFMAAQQAAVSAVAACAPYDWLPKDRYDLWKSIVWDFAPRGLDQ